MRKLAKDKDVCIFCGSAENLTKEHAISKNLFPEDYRRNNIITVPSCRKCNASYSQDEELFRLFVVNQSTVKSQAARDMLHSKITRAMKRAPGKAFNVLKAMFPVSINLPDGRNEDKVAFKVTEQDWRGHHLVLDKYVKALFYHHLGQILPEGQNIVHTFVHDKALFDDEIMSALKWNLDNKEIYSYGYSIVPDTLQSLWYFSFYETVVFHSIAAFPKDFETIKN